MSTFLVAVAGALGAVARYRIGLAVGVRSFPWATLAVNISGSFLLAFVLVGPATSRWSTATSTAVAVGFVGAYTTFSTFGYETMTMLRTDRFAAAAGYVAVSVFGGVAATILGYAAGRSLV